jgi:periplasmic protein TonB
MRYMKRSWWRRLARSAFVGVGALLLTAAQFLILPIIQSISHVDRTDTLVRAIDAQALEAPPPLEEPEPEEEPEEEEPPPEVADDSEPLDLAQLELALNASFGEGLGGGDFAMRLTTGAAAFGGPESFSGLGEVDLKPRATYLAQPNITDKMRKKGRGRVTLVFMVNERGRVEMPRVESSSDPVFNEACLSAIRQFRFEPGQRGGKAVRSPARQVFNF